MIACCVACVCVRLFTEKESSGQKEGKGCEALGEREGDVLEDTSFGRQHQQERRTRHGCLALTHAIQGEKERRRTVVRCNSRRLQRRRTAVCGSTSFSPSRQTRRPSRLSEGGSLSCNAGREREKERADDGIHASINNQAACACHTRAGLQSSLGERRVAASASVQCDL